MAADDHLGPQFKTVGRRRLPITETTEMFHGTTGENAASIVNHGFSTPTAYLTPHRDLAEKYAQGAVSRAGGGEPAVLRTAPIRGVSASETGYGSPDLNREAGADYMDKGPEVISLQPHTIRGIRRV